MATHEEREALMSVSCPWCGASAGKVCVPASSNRSRTDKVRERRGAAALGIRTLDGGCHEARWQKALGRPARTLVAGGQ